MRAAKIGKTGCGAVAGSALPAKLTAVHTSQSKADPAGLIGMAGAVDTAAGCELLTCANFSEATACLAC